MLMMRVSVAFPLRVLDHGAGCGMVTLSLMTAKGVAMNILATIVSGIVSGVSAGLILALFFWVFRLWRERRERREQIERLAKSINAARSAMFERGSVLYNRHNRVAEFLGRSQAEKKRLIFVNICKDIDSILKEESSQLSFEEKYNIHLNIEKYLQTYSEDSDLLNDGEYKATFEMFESFQWLKLPKYRLRQAVRSGRIRRWFRFGRQQNK